MRIVKRARARKTDPETSHEAAASVSDLRRSQQEVLEAVRDLEHATDDEIFAYLNAKGVLMSPSGARTRRKELVDAGLVRDSGFPGRTASGRRAIKWEVVP